MQNITDTHLIQKLKMTRHKTYISIKYLDMRVKIKKTKLSALYKLIFLAT